MLKELKDARASSTGLAALYAKKRSFYAELDRWQRNRKSDNCWMPVDGDWAWGVWTAVTKCVAGCQAFL